MERLLIIAEEYTEKILSHSLGMQEKGMQGRNKNI
jgi:hypothetical protein